MMEMQSLEKRIEAAIRNISREGPLRRNELAIKAMWHMEPPRAEPVMILKKIDQMIETHHLTSKEGKVSTTPTLHSLFQDN